MTYSIIGSGNVGSALARAIRAQRHRRRHRQHAWTRIHRGDWQRNSAATSTA